MKQIKVFAYEFTHLATEFITEDPAVISFIDDNGCDIGCHLLPFINDGVSVDLRC